MYRRELWRVGVRFFSCPYSHDHEKKFHRLQASHDLFWKPENPVILSNFALH
jgi:hypothetical protein